MTAETQIMQELKEIRQELNFIKQHMVDADTILTKEEVVLLDEALEEHKRGETTTIDDLRKELR